MTDSIDTNIVLRCILGDIPAQRKAAARLITSSNSKHYLSNLAILECVYVLEMVEEMTRVEIVDHLNFFLTHYSEYITYDHESVAVAFSIYLEHPKLSWGDCLLAAESESLHREPLFTFDKKFARQAPQAKLVE